MKERFLWVQIELGSSLWAESGSCLLPNSNVFLSSVNQGAALKDQLEPAEVNWIPMVALQHLVVPCTCCAVSLSPVLLGLGPQFATHLFTHLAFQHWSARPCNPNSNKTNLWNHTCLPSCISRSLGLRKGSERTKELETSFHLEPSAPTVLLKEVLKDPVKWCKHIRHLFLYVSVV